MARAEQQRTPRGRLTAAAVRALSLVMALLLAGSWLAQIAHFALIPHAFCAEHGELLELRGSSRLSAGKAVGVEASPTARANAADVEDGHDHCQLLARSQREQLLPPATAVDITPAATSSELAVLLARADVTPPFTCLMRAPKTSPPPRVG